MGWHIFLNWLVTLVHPLENHIPTLVRLSSKAF